MEEEEFDFTDVVDQFDFSDVVDLPNPFQQPLPTTQEPAGLPVQEEERSVFGALGNIPQAAMPVGTGVVANVIGETIHRGGKAVESFTTNTIPKMLTNLKTGLSSMDQKAAVEFRKRLEEDPQFETQLIDLESKGVEIRRPGESFKQALDRGITEATTKTLGLEQQAQQYKTQAAADTKGSIQELSEVGSAKDFANWLGTTMGQMPAQMALSIGTAGMASYLMESAEVYDQQLDLLSEKYGLSREEVIKRNLDDPAAGQAWAIIAGSLDAVSAGNIVGLFRRSAAKKAGEKTVKDVLKQVGGSTVGEFGTEALQGQAETYGATIGADTEFEWDWKKFMNEGAAGMAGAGPMSFASLAFEKTPKAKPVVQVFEREEASVGVKPIVANEQDAIFEEELSDLTTFGEELGQPKPITNAVPTGMVRVYHSGSAGDGQSGRWASTNKQYASDYRKDQPLFYTDIPESDPRLQPEYADQSVSKGFDKNFELTPEEAVNLKQTERDAVQEQSTTDVDVREQTTDGTQVAEGDITQQTTTQEGQEEITQPLQQSPEQVEFDAAMAAYTDDPSEQNSNRVKAAQQALQSPSEPSKAANASDQIKLLEQDGVIALEGKADGTFAGRVENIINQLIPDPQDQRNRDLKALASKAAKTGNKNDFTNFINKLKEANQTDTTTITRKSLRDQLREAWSKGITFGVKDAETRVKNLISGALNIIKEAGAKLPPAKYESIIKRIKGLNTKNEAKVLEMLDYVGRVAEDAKVAEQIEQIEKLQARVKAKKGVLPENQQRLIDKLVKINPTDITDLDEFVALLNDLASNMITPGKSGRGPAVEATRLKASTEKAYNEYVDAVRRRAMDAKQAADDLFADEKSMENKDAIERGLLYTEVNSLLPFIPQGIGRIKSKVSEVLRNITDSDLARLSTDEIKQLIRGIEQVVKNDDYSNLAKVYPLLFQIQNSHRYDNIRNLAPGSKSAIGKSVPSQKLANLSQIFEYLYNGLSASAAKLAQWSGVRDIVNGAANARSREHEFRVRLDELRKKIEKGTKVDLTDPENIVRLDVYGEFAQQMEGIEDQQMLENAMHNWRVSSQYYKKTGDPDNARVAKIIDQMLLLFDGAKSVDQVKSRMEQAYPEVKKYKDGISDILEELTPEIKEVAETILGKQPKMYKPGSYWPQSTQYTGDTPIDAEQYPLGIKLALPDNLIERVPKLQSGQARRIRGVEGVMQSITESLDAIEVGEGRNLVNAFLNLDAREGNKYLGASQTNIALGTLLRESFSQKVQGGLFDRSLNTIRRVAAATVLTGIKSAVSQYIPTMLRTISDFALKRISQGKMPNIFMNGANTPSAKKLRSFYAISKRGERALGTYVGDISNIEKSYTGINKFRDKAADFFDDVLRQVGQFIPKYTFNFADTSAAERAWTTAYLDYLDSKGVDISNHASDEFWANEVSKKNDPIRKEAASAAEQYVSVNQMESGSLETPPVYKTQQLINAIIPFTKYLTGKATVMSNRVGTLVGGVTNGKFGTPKSTKQETINAGRQLAADYVELVAFHAIVKHLLIYPLQDTLVNSYLESLDLEPEDEEALEKRNRTRTGYSLMELVTSGAVPIVPLIILSQVIPDSMKADAWNKMLENIGKEEDQTTSEFRETTELPVVPNTKDAQQMLGILGVLESQASLNQDWKYERIDGDPYIIYKDMKGDTITKAISEEEADALDNGLLISMYGVLGLKDLADVMKQVERIVARRTMKAKKQTVLP